MVKTKALIRSASFWLGFVVALPFVFTLALIRAFLRPMITAFREGKGRRGKVLNTADHKVAKRPEEDGSAAPKDILHLAGRGAYRN